VMFDPELFEAIANKKVYHGKLDLPAEAYPDWNQLVPYFDMSFLNGNRRARNPHKIFAEVKDSDFPIVKNISVELSKKLSKVGISSHCYAGFSPNAFASPIHADPMQVLFIMIQGSMPWKVFANGKDEKSTFSRRLSQGDYVYVPKGIYHVALPDSSRVGFSFGW